jgi:hypothetical protein
MSNANGSQGSESIFVAPEASETAGAISYWRLSGNVELAALALAWAGQGLDKDLLPAQPGDEVALGRAVRDQAGKRRVVRPLGKRGAWVIKDEAVAASGDDVVHTRVCTVKFESGSAAIEPGEVPSDVFEATAAAIRAGFRQARVELAPEDISGWLIALARDRAAVSLRDSGGIYFVPRTGVEFWRKAVKAIESVGAHRIFQIPALKNSEAIDAILDAVTNETRAAAEAIEAELVAEGDDALGARALKTRAEACGSLLSKVEAYENLLGVKLPALVTRIEDLRAGVAAAALKTESAADAAAA